MTTDQTGDIGELVASLDLSRPVMGHYKRPLFKPSHLGGKYPTVDFIVDILAPNSESKGFFFVQVKATEEAINAARRLPVSVTTEKFNKLVTVPVPTYLIGVDRRNEQSYIVTACRRRNARVSSIITDYSLKDDSVKISLYKEVVQYWKLNRHPPISTNFRDV